MLVVVLALHWLAARWVDKSRTVRNPEIAQHVPVVVELLKPKPVEQKPALQPAPPPPKVVHIAPKPAPPVHVAEAPVMATQATNAPTPVTSPDAQALAQAANQAAASAAAAAALPAQPTPAPKPAAPGDKISVPPSGDLRYDTLVNGVMNQTGTIHWTNDGQHYEMVVSIPLPFVGPFVYSSKGHVDAFGIAPEQYSEQRGRRAADITVFDRATKQLVFTRTPNSQPLADGAVDRFSVVMQLASLVRGSPDTYKPGVVRQFSVADNDSSEIWPMETVGDEQVQAPDGNVIARHFTRLARREGDRRRLDIWLAPSLGWLPVRILQTEPNGLQIEMLWRGKLQAPTMNAPTQPDAGTPDASQQSDKP